MKKVIVTLTVIATLLTNTCNAFALENYNDVDNAGGSGNSRMSLTVENTGTAENSIFSAWVPSELPITMDLDGNVIVPNTARIINGVETKGIQVTELEVKLEDSWVLAGFDEDFEAKKEDLKEIAVQFRGDRVSTNGTCLLTAGNWNIPKDSYIDLQMRAKIPKQTEHGEREQISTVSFTLDWSGDDETVGPEVPSGSFEIRYIDGEHGTIVDKTSLYTNEYGKIIGLPDVEPDDGYEILEWIDVDTGLEVKYGDIIYSEITIQPVFILSESSLPENKVRIIFKADEGGSVQSVGINVTKGITWGQISQPLVVPDEGYEFIGWYIKDAEVSDNLAIEANTEVIAKFKLTESTYEYFTYSIDGGNVIITGLSDMYEEATENSNNTQVPSDLIIPEYIQGRMVVGIDDGAFFGEDYITSVKMPDTITSIGDYAFVSCPRLTRIDISDNVKTLGYSFCAQTALGSVIIPDNVKEIGDGSFSYCTKLRDVTIGDNVESLGIGVLQGCTSLKSIEIPNNVQVIGDSSLSDCSLQSITIGTGLKEIGFAALSNNESLKSVVVDSENSNMKSIDNVIYSKDGKVLILVPGGIQGRYEILEGTEEIAKTAMYSHSKLTGVSVPDTLTKIGLSAFEKTTGISSIQLPDTLEEIEGAAFKESYIESIEIPSNVEVIPEECFSNCIILTDVSLHEDITEIDDHAFYKCTRLSSIDIPEGILRIGRYAFSKTYNLEEVSIDAINCDIDNYAFSESTIVTADVKVNSINTNMFLKCKNLKEASVYATESIGSYLFSNCDSLVKVRYENHEDISMADVEHQTIANYTFNNCMSLTDVELIAPKLSLGVAYIDGSRKAIEFVSCTRLKNLKLTIDLIDDETFYNNDNLESVEIVCNQIDPMAFYDCDKIKYITVEADNIMNRAFDSCNAVETIDVNVADTISQYAFRYVDSVKTANINTDTLGIYAVYGCKQMSNVKINANTLSQYAFYNVLGVDELIINANTIDGYALRGSEVKQLYLDATTTKDNALRYSKVVNADIKNIKSAGGSMFSDDAVLETVKIKDCSTVGDYAFNNCILLETVEITGMKSLSTRMFNQAYALKSVKLPSDLETINGYAFASCKSLEDIVIPDSVTILGTSIFYNCSALTNVKLSDSIKSIPSQTFYGCEALNNVNISDNVVSIQSQAFFNCTGFTNLVIPSSVTTIGSNAFWEVPLVTYNGTASGSPWGATRVVKE